MEKLIYYAAGNREKENRMKRLADMLSADFTAVSAAQCGQQIGFLAGITDFGRRSMTAPAQPLFIGEDILIFSGLAGERLDMALSMLKNSGITVALKAIVTEHNVTWTLETLYRELSAERAEINRRME